MAKFEFDKEKMRRLKKNIEAEALDYVRRGKVALAQWGEDTVEDIGSLILKKKLVDQGQYLGSTSRDPVRFFGKVLRQAVYNNAEHVFTMEHGRKPREGKKPPLLPLIAWAKRHGMITALPTNVNLNSSLQKKLIAAYSIRKKVRQRGSKGSKKKNTVEDPEIKDFMIAIGIKDAIWERGTKGHKVFTTIYERKRRTFAKDITRMIKSVP